MGPVDLLGGYRQATWQLGGLVAAAAQPAEHPGRLASAGLVVGGQGFLDLLTVGRGPGQLTAAVAGGLVELAAQPIPLGPQLPCREQSEIWATGGIDGQPLAASPRQDVGELQVGVGLVPIRQVQLPGALGFGTNHRMGSGCRGRSYIRG